MSTWHDACPSTCRFAVERLFTSNPTLRATSAETAAFTQSLIAERPEHATALQSSLTKLASATQQRSDVFDSLRKRIRMLEPALDESVENLSFGHQPQLSFQAA